MIRSLLCTAGLTREIAPETPSYSEILWDQIMRPSFFLTANRFPAQSGKYTASPNTVGVADTSPPVVKAHLTPSAEPFIGPILCSSGQNLSNTRSQPAYHNIGPTNVSARGDKWAGRGGGDVSATPTVFGDAVYFPDWAGNLFAVRKNDGRMIWSHKISEYDGVSGAISRVSPA